VITGWFEESQRPFVECHVFIPRLRVSGKTAFLFDTGAQVTSLHPHDSEALGVPFRQLGFRTNSRGVGGLSPYFLEPALLVFEDGTQIRIYGIDLRIGDPNESNRLIPSLLGRNVIHRWSVRYNAMSRQLDCLVLSADHTFDAT
jgi:hypothetical protein